MDRPVRLIITGNDANQAELMFSTLKSAGYSIKLSQVSQLAALAEAMRDHAPDLVLCIPDPANLSLRSVLKAVHQAGKHIPVIAIAADPSEETRLEALQIGATDLIGHTQSEYLKLVVARTYEAQRQWRQLKSLEATLQACEKRNRALLDSSREAICYLHEGMYIYANLSFLERFGHADVASVEGTPFMNMVAPEDQAKAKELLRNIQSNTNAEQRFTLKLGTAKGKTCSVELSLQPATMDGELCIQLVIHDQQAPHAQSQHARYFNQYDPITGLYSRKHALEQIKSVLSEAVQGKASYGLLRVQITNLADLKQRLGVASTDIALADAAKLLKQHADPQDLLAHFSEEAFVLLTPHWETAALEVHAVKQVQTLAQATFDVDQKSVSITACAGGVRIDENAPDLNELLKQLEKACEQAQGKPEGIALYTPKQEEMTQRQLDQVWADRLHEALNRNRLHLIFQPVVSLSGDTAERYETYLRLTGEDGQTISTLEFLPSAERAGLVTMLDRWVIGKAFERLAEQRRLKPDSIFFIKLTGGTLQDPQIMPWIADEVRRYRLPPTSLVFEIKAQVVINYLKQAKDFVKGLHELHAQFALDDFGMGLNPFQLLNTIPADYLKIDRSLMLNFKDNPEQQETVRTIAHSAQQAGRIAIAPYVEDAATLALLWGMGVGYVQGNFLQAPTEALNYDFLALG